MSNRTKKEKSIQTDEENIIENKIYNEMKRETIIASSLFEKVENSIWNIQMLLQLKQQQLQQQQQFDDDNVYNDVIKSLYIYSYNNIIL